MPSNKVPGPQRREEVLAILHAYYRGRARVAGLRYSRSSTWTPWTVIFAGTGLSGKGVIHHSDAAIEQMARKARHAKTKR